MDPERERGARMVERLDLPHSVRLIGHQEHLRCASCDSLLGGPSPDPTRRTVLFFIRFVPAQFARVLTFDPPVHLSLPLPTTDPAVARESHQGRPHGRYPPLRRRTGRPLTRLTRRRSPHRQSWDLPMSARRRGPILVMDRLEGGDRGCCLSTTSSESALLARARVRGGLSRTSHRRDTRRSVLARARHRRRPRRARDRQVGTRGDTGRRPVSGRGRHSHVSRAGKHGYPHPRGRAGLRPGGAHTPSPRRRLCAECQHHKFTASCSRSRRRYPVRGSVGAARRGSREPSRARASPLARSPAGAHAPLGRSFAS